MKLSAPMEALRSRFGDEGTIRKMADAGFDAIDYTFNEMTNPECVWNTQERLAYAKKLFQIGKEEGISFNQAHMPFLFNWDLLSPDTNSYSKSIYPVMERAFEICDVMEIPIIIVHPIHHMRYKGNEENLWNWNIQYYKDLCSIAGKYNVKIALENMWQVDPDLDRGSSDVFSIPTKYKDFYDTLNNPKVVACVDVGHAGLSGEDPADLILTLGKRVEALHIHDNRGVDDDHTLPYLGSLDWESITTALASIKYGGDFTFEVKGNFINSYDDDFIDSALKYEVETGRYLIKKIEDKKSLSGLKK